MEEFRDRLKELNAKLDDPYFFEESEEEILKILESTKHLRCQKKYMINYFFYLQKITSVRFSVNVSKIRILILIVNSFLETGFKPNGMSFSDISSEEISFESLEPTSGPQSHKHDVYLELLSNFSPALKHFPCGELKKGKMQKLVESNRIFHYWDIIEILMEDTPTIQFINQYYSSSDFRNEKALAL